MTLATALLTFIYPHEYVVYKWGLMSGFFEVYSSHEVRQGYNPTQYWKLNLACRNQILTELQRGLEEKEPTMLDVYTLLYVWDRHYKEKWRNQRHSLWYS